MKTTGVKAFAAGVLFFILSTSSAWAADPNTVATPVFNPDGGTYNTEQDVIITCSTQGTTIRYTIDGSDPNIGAVYDPNVPVLIDYTLTLKAKACKDGFTQSSVKSATYNLIVATPVFTPDGGNYESEQTVIITCATADSEIHYTYSNDPNTIPDPQLSDPIIEDGGSIVVSVDPLTYLKAKAWKINFYASTVKTAVYKDPNLILLYSGGAGIPENPYVIACKEDLLELSATTTDYDKCFILFGDINLEGQIFSAAIIAPDIDFWNNGFQGTEFTGIFNGNGYKISNFIIESPTDFVGLFGSIGPAGQITNLGLENFSVSGVPTWMSYSHYVGGLAGYNQGNVRNCYSIGDVSGTEHVGGLVGETYFGSIHNCYSIGSVTGDTGYESLIFINVGGLVGGSEGCSIVNCFATGSVSGDDYVGGLVGYNYQGTISNCYATGSVDASYDSGGLTGYNYGSIKNCSSFSTVSSSGPGGLVGDNYGIISNCYSNCNADGIHYAGGLVAGNHDGSISKCYTTGTVNSSRYAGGIVGYDSRGNIDFCYATGSVAGGYYIGGLAGYTYYGQVNNCYSTGFVGGSSNVGGLIGLNYSTVTNCFWDIETSGRTYSAGGTGKTTAEMQTLSTFTSVGWDFANETANGGNDIWRMCVDGIDYPYLNWESIEGDFACPDGVSTEDLDYFVGRWLMENCTSDNNYCSGVDMDLSGKVDLEDWAIFAERWLAM